MKVSVSYSALTSEESEIESKPRRCTFQYVLFVFFLFFGSVLTGLWLKGYDIRGLFTGLVLESLFGIPDFIEEEPVMGTFREEGRTYMVHNDFHHIGSLQRQGKANAIITRHGENEQTLDYGQTCRMTLAPKGYLTGWKYKVDSVLPDCVETKASNMRCGIVHHMNLYGIKNINDFVREKSQESDWCMRHPDKLWPLGNYDRGALAFSFPEGYGVNLNPFTHLLLETHYLLPAGYQMNSEGITDRSGYTLYVVPSVQQSVSMYGWVNRDMKVPSGRQRFDYVSQASADIPLGKYWGKHSGKSVQVIAIHQHHHDYAREKYIEVKDRKGKTKYKTKVESVSPSDLSTETWKYIFKLQLSPGDTLSMHCFYNTEPVDYQIQYGLGNTDEMCGTVFYADIDTEEATPISEAWYSADESATADSNQPIGI